MKKFIILTLTFGLLYSCQSTEGAFSLKKKRNADEFLVEKKNPLVLPPKFEKLPIPSDSKVSDQKNEDFKSIIDNDSKSEQGGDSIESSSTEDFILKKIKKNDTN